MTRSGMAIALGVAAALAGCSPGVPFDDPTADYMQRSLTVSPTSGNVQAGNLAIQTRTPWPREAQYTSIPVNGSKMVKAVQNYESGAGGGPPASVGGASTGGASGLSRWMGRSFRFVNSPSALSTWSGSSMSAH
jgi:hypothetical protein